MDASALNDNSTTDVESSDDERTAEDILSSIHQNISVFDTFFHECHSRFSMVKQKAEEETVGPLSEIVLEPKPHLVLWLEARKLPKDTNFRTFFEVFLEEHRLENRCDISERSITLNKEASILLGYEGTDTVVHILDVLGKLPMIFH
jgi:hypothetical protein